MKNFNSFKKRLKNYYKWNVSGKEVSEKDKNRIKTAFMHIVEGLFENNYEKFKRPVNQYALPSQFRKLCITDIKFRDRDGIINIEITLEYPGLLIGKGGRTIKTVAEKLTEHMDKKININVVQSTLWNINKN